MEGQGVAAQLIALMVAGVLALALRTATGTWVHPSTLFAGAWVIFLGVSTLFSSVLFPSPVTAWLIVGAIAAVSISAPFAIRTSEVTPAHVVANIWLARFVWSGSVSAVLSALVTQRANGISIIGAISLDSVSRAARQLTVLRYSVMTAPALATILLALTYGAALAAPFAAASRKGASHRVLICAPAAGGVLYTALTTARAPFLIVIAITVSAWAIVRGVTDGGRPRFSRRSLLEAVISAALIGGVFAWGAATRSGGFTSKTGVALLRSVSVYAGGSIPAFEVWQHDTGSPRFGAQTFAGIAQFLVEDNSLGSAYKDFVRIGDGLGTNVYTALRSLAEDFTLPGMLGALAVFSIIAARGYRRAITRGSVTGAVIAAVWGAFVLFSQTESIFVFGNVTVGLIVGGFLVRRFTELAPAGIANEAELTPGGTHEQFSQRPTHDRLVGRRARIGGGREPHVLPNVQRHIVNPSE